MVARVFLLVAISAAPLSSLALVSNKSKQNRNPLKVPKPFVKTREHQFFDPFQLSKNPSDTDDFSPAAQSAALVSGIALLAVPTAASAAVVGASNALPSAIGAYAHFASLLVIVAATVVERCLIKPGMSEEAEDMVAIADIMLGVFGFILFFSGYQRAVNLEKGWEFYSHESTFWLKMTLTAIYGATTFFNTTKIIQRSVAKRNGEFTPMSEALATRMVQLANVGLLALAAIPLSATLMARGVGYNQDFPWPVGAAFTAVALFGLGYKYIKEALEFDESNQAPIETK